MHASVAHAFHAFSRPLEGRLRSMYVDVKNLVTTGTGNLIDPAPLALELPWKHGKTGALATASEVAAAWAQLKHHPGFAVKAGGPLVPLSKLSAKVAASLNDLRLDDADIDALVERKLGEFEAYITAKHFPAFGTYPADAQLGILSMAWAVGPGFPQTFSNFKRAVLDGDWQIAIACCKIREEGNPGIVPRNARNRALFANANVVVDRKLDPSVLWWPNVPTSAETVGDDEKHWTARRAQELAQAALDTFTATEAERLKNEGPSGGRALLDYEAAEDDDGGSNNA